MSQPLKHGFLFTLVAASIGLSVALFSRSSPAADHSDGRLSIDPKSTVEVLLGDSMKQAVLLNEKILLADRLTDGQDNDNKPVLNVNTARFNFNFPKSGQFLNLKPNRDKLKRFQKNIRAIRARVPGDDLPEVPRIAAGDLRESDDKKKARMKAPGTLKNTPRRFLWNVGFKEQVPVKSEILVLPRRHRERDGD